MNRRLAAMLRTARHMFQPLGGILKVLTDSRVWGKT